MIHLHALNKVYKTREGQQIEALRDINFGVKDGEFITVVGPSGCGKSTLLKILAGILTYTSGKVELAGKRIQGPSRDVGVVFQSPVLLPWRTVHQNILLPKEICDGKTERDDDTACHYLDLVGLSGFGAKYPAELSGGMQQRVGIARALIHDPKLLLMDEPFGALDAMTRENMNLDLLNIWAESKKTVLLVTHSIPEAVFLADRVIVMSARPGRISEILDIDLPRPRGLGMINSEEFGKYVASIREHFNTQGGLD